MTRGRVILSPRLAAVAALVPHGHAMADIGTDHGRLPAFLVETGWVPRAVGVDVKPGPLAVAQALGASLGLGAALEYRLGSGCTGLCDVHTLTAAGMGGPMIARIVGGARAVGVSHLVLQPNIGDAFLRRWLDTNRWEITAEVLVIDRGPRFVVIAAEAMAPAGRDAAGIHTPTLDAVNLAYGSARVHRDLVALAGRLDDDEERLRDLLAHHGGDRAEAAIRGQLALVQAARDRIGVP